MGRKSNIGMLTALGAMLSVANESYGGEEYHRAGGDSTRSNNDNVMRMDLNAGEEAQKIRQGQKKFYFGENYVWARDEKNAKRKAKNKNYI